MKTKFFLSILLTVISFSFLSCENRKVAVLAFNRGPGVPADVAYSARKVVTDVTIKRKKYDVISTSLIDERVPTTSSSAMSDIINEALYLGTDIIIVGNITLIETTSKGSKVDQFLDSLKSNKAQYKVEVNCIDTKKDSVIASFTEIYNEDLKKMDKKVKKLKLGGRKFSF